MNFFFIQFQEIQMIAPTPAGPTKIEEKNICVIFVVHSRSFGTASHLAQIILTFTKQDFSRLKGLAQKLFRP